MKTEHKCWNCRNSYANLCGWFEFKIGGTEQSIPKGCEYYKNKNGFRITKCPNFVSDKPLTKQEIAVKNNMTYATYLAKLRKLRKSFAKKVDIPQK